MAAAWSEIILGCQWNPWLHLLSGIRAATSVDKRQPGPARLGCCSSDTGLLLTQVVEVGRGKYMVVCSSWNPDAFLLKIIQLHFNPWPFFLTCNGCSQKWHWRGRAILSWKLYMSWAFWWQDLRGRNTTPQHTWREEQQGQSRVVNVTLKQSRDTVSWA